MVICSLCGTGSSLISGEIAVCVGCIRKNPENAVPLAMKAHFKSRKAFGLPEKPPRNADGVFCNMCANECRIPENGVEKCADREYSSAGIEIQVCRPDAQPAKRQERRPAYI